MSNETSGEPSTMRNVLSTLLRLSFPYVIIISAIGICGNFLTIILLSKRSISKNFNNCTLIALALTDLLFNLMLVSRSITDLTQSRNEQLCRLLSFLSHLAELLSACFTAQFTAQRFIAVRFPLSVFIEKKIHLIHYLVVSLSIIFGVVYCIFLVKNNEYEDCHEELPLAWFLSDTLSSFLIPFTIIIVLNILTIIHLKKGFQNNQQVRFTKRSVHADIMPVNFPVKNSISYEMKLKKHFRPKFYENILIKNAKDSVVQKQTQEGQLLIKGRTRSLDLLQRPSIVHTKSQSYRVTRMLILVSTCFLVLNAPFHVCAIGLKVHLYKPSIAINDEREISGHQLNQIVQQQNKTSFDNRDFLFQAKLISYENEMTNHLKRMESFYVLVVITQYISYASYSINFLLYSLCGMKFRHELVRFMSKQRHPKGATRSIALQNTL
ncbi:unnamed protein product [Adineta ricciae]|uniref:G-protein coupled receptors family 1 profile domain-containing protein n=1 Tax=Adineta ricciae TaxID=249248 RepID=A0A814MD31_ADIRI|nr:unnamed protein product [Adineta ricciae]CAF1074917.1 unnamed protein product [Adineta ricciae]